MKYLDYTESDQTMGDLEVTANRICIDKCGNNETSTSTCASRGECSSYQTRLHLTSALFTIQPSYNYFTFGFRRENYTTF